MSAALTQSEAEQAQKTMRDAEERMRGITDEYFREKTGEDVTGPTEVTGEEETTVVTETEDLPEKKDDEVVGDPPEKKDEEGEVEKGEKKDDEVVVTETTTTTTTEEEPDEEEKAIDSISLGKNAHPKSQKALKFLQTKAKDALRAAKKAEQTLLEERERAASAKVLDEPTEKELTELREFRRRVEIEHDPEINAKYDKRLEELQGRALQVLKSAGLPESTAQYIQKNGGALKFRSSRGTMPKGLVDATGKPLAQHPDGRPFTHHEFYKQFIEPELSPEQGEAMIALGIRATDLTLERDQELTKAKANSAEFFKGRQDEATKGREAWIGKVRAGALKQVTDLGAKLLEVPANATKEQKAKIDKLNAEYKQAESISQRVLESADPEEMGKMAVIYAYHQTRFKREASEKDASLESWKTRAEAAEKKLEAIKNASKTPHSSAPVETVAKTKTIDQITDPGERMAARMAANRK